MGYQDNRIKSLLQQHPYSLIPIGSHNHVSVASATPVSITSGANGLLVQASVQNIRFTIDGTTPTASSGFTLKAGNDPLVMTAATEDCVFTFIAETAGAFLDYQTVRIGGC